MSVIPQTSSLCGRLRESTRLHHQRAEERLLERDLMAGKLPRETYVALLGQRLLIHRALEALLLEWRAGDPLRGRLVQEELLQAPRLEADLEFFGTTPGFVEPVSATQMMLRHIGSSAGQCGLLGFLYVLEGSKNGARFVARSVRGAYELPDGHGIAYLDPHGERQSVLWQQFKEAMDALKLDPREEEQVVNAASQAFDDISAIDDELYG